jgi:hypothetical protein
MHQPRIRPSRGMQVGLVYKVHLIRAVVRTLPCGGAAGSHIPWLISQAQYPIGNRTWFKPAAAIAAKSASVIHCHPTRNPRKGRNDATTQVKHAFTEKGMKRGLQCPSAVGARSGRRNQIGVDRRSIHRRYLCCRCYRKDWE